MSAKTIFLIAAAAGLIYIAFRAKKNVESLFSTPMSNATEPTTGA